MCGIFGCVLRKGNAAPMVHAALKRLEYRGYDSVGEATISGGRLYVKKDRGKIDEVHKIHNLDDLPGNIGIGHTRWATHGAPLQVNAHPHLDCKGQIAVIHNGIIENFAELRQDLENHGHVLKSKTDTEVMAHLIEDGFNNRPSTSFADVVLEAVKKVEGSYSFAVVSTKEPDKIVCARNESPLVIGVADEGFYCASDIPALLPLTKKTVIVENGELVTLSPENLEIKKIVDSSIVVRKPKLTDWSPEMAVKGGYPHFMSVHEKSSL
jgi:glucosamine--fructose-6-phosphate aminotransferase (isomerizing)